MPKLALTVHAHDPETGRTVVLNRGTEVEGRLLTLITNPGVWEDPDAAAEAAAAFESSQTEDDEATDAVVEPPRAGKGSSRDAWALFAANHGVQVEDDDTRDDIIAALADAGVIDE
jgi:hypothetical protein